MEVEPALEKSLKRVPCQMFQTILQSGMKCMRYKGRKKIRRNGKEKMD